MDYNVEDIEDQVLATLQDQSALTDVEIATHAGEINIHMFTDPEHVEGLIPRAPFIYVRYRGRTNMSTTPESLGRVNRHELQWQIYVAAESLRATQESQRSCYSMLRGIYDALHGAWPNGGGTNVPVGSIVLTAAKDATTGNPTPIANPLFYAMSPLLEAGGLDEKLVIQLPHFAVYSTTYKILMRA